MKKQHSVPLLVIFLITACSSGSPIVIVEPIASATPISKPATPKTAESSTDDKTEIVLLDFALSPDGKKTAIYLNTGVYLYDIETMEKTTLYEFESDEYFSDLNAWGTIYPPFSAPGALGFSPDGNKIAISGKIKDEYIAIWDLSTHKIADYISNYPNGNYVRELVYHPNSETFLIRSTYPLSQLHCVDMGGSEDTLTMISLDTKS